MPISLLDLQSVTPRLVGPAAMQVIDTLQRHRPVDQAAGLALAFVLLCRKLGIHPGNALGVAERMTREDTEFYPELKAAMLYINNEIPR